MLGHLRQRIGDLDVPTFNRVQIALCRRIGRMAESLTEVGEVRTGGSCQALTGVPQVVEGQCGADLVSCTNEDLIDRVASHPLTVAAHEEVLLPCVRDGVCLEHV